MTAKYSRSLVFFVFLVVCVSSVSVQAQEPVGGPYEPDSATVLLMHFDNNFDNASDAYNMASPEVHGNVNFLEMRGAGELGSQVRFDNDSPNDKSHLQVPDTAALDLTGNWTIEYWLNVFKFGILYRPSDWRYYQTILMKPGNGMPSNDRGYAKANYYTRVPFEQRRFRAGYYSGRRGTWIEDRSPYNILEIGHWFHVVFIRDTSKNAIIQMIHQNAEEEGRLPYEQGDSLKLVYFNAHHYEEDAKPRTSDQPLFIGSTPERDTLFGNLDGFMDELRISNVVRNFAMPPVITNVTKLDNQPAGKEVRIDASIETYGGTELVRRKLHYKIDDGNWQSKDLLEESGDTFSARIPGQPIGTDVKYRVMAETKQGLKAFKPAREPGDDNTYYEFTTWRDSTQVLNLDFEQAQDGEPPADQSMYKNVFSVNGQPTYPQVEGRGQVLRLSAENKTSISTEAGVLSLPSFAIDLKFQATDSLPANGQTLLIKEGGRLNPPPNYEIRFSHGGRVTVSTTIPGLTTINVLPPYKTITDTPIVPGQWYRLWFSYQPDTMRARLFSLEDSTHIAGFTDPLRYNSFSQSSRGSFRIGTKPRVYDQQWFNGMVDDVRIYNYIPRYFKKTFTGTPEKPELPDRVKLNQNYPNPFNNTTQINFLIPDAMQVNLSIYDVLGRRIATLVDGRKKEGRHQVTFNAEGLASGIYFMRLITETEIKTRKMLYVK